MKTKIITDDAEVRRLAKRGGIWRELRQAKRWAKRIAEAHAQSVEAIIRVGQLLIEAKAECSHGEWGEITGRTTGKPMLPFSRQTAERYMAIARSQALSNAAHVRHLPPSWSTLYELTKLPDEDLERYIADGRIHPEMTCIDRGSLERAPLVRAERPCLMSSHGPF